jgi:SAM-dependent methyltransferase
MRGFGIWRTVGFCVSVIEDYYLELFDRIYRVHTSGHIPLNTASVDSRKVKQASKYSPVNAWALRRLFRTLNLPKNLWFADLGCGLGRACMLAAEYGFARVTGIDISPEFCQIARNNAAIFRSRVVNSTPVNIIQTDALEYSRVADDDVFFMFRPFSSSEFLEIVVSNLANRAKQFKKTLTVIYTERMTIPSSEVDVFTRNQAFQQLGGWIWMGQAFYVYECRA